MRQSSLRPPSLLVDEPSNLRPLPPSWVTHLLRSAARSDLAGVHVHTTAELSFLQTRIENAVAMSGDELREAVAAVYAELGTALAIIDRSPVRMWNYMPQPTARLDAGRDRYMAFNQGRADGYLRWPGRPQTSDALFPTASAVGITGDDLVVLCLASAMQGTPVENPRQVPAWRYSARYGPTPPSFARATATTIADRQWLLIAGTASVVGEDTAHAGDISGQLAETLENLNAVVASALSGGPAIRRLDRLVNLRAYLTRAQDASFVRDRLAATCPRLTDLELVIAPLCRENLLVEIEGVADLSPPA